MFGKFFKKVVKNEDTQDKLEEALGKDLDGDGDIGGKPIEQEPEEEQAEERGLDLGGLMGGGDGDEEGGFDLGGLMESGKVLLSKNGGLKPTKEGGLMGMLGSFGSMSPTVQQDASREVQKLDDGENMPLSALDGDKKSLFVGINYFGTSAELRGCINDVKNVQNLITSKFGFPRDPRSMRTLVDDATDPSELPTRANIVAGMKWLIEGAKEGDSLFFHYSGHGAYAQDVKPDTDEADGQDETLCPMDYATAGMIVDDDIFDMMVAPLPKGVRLTVITDCCHSGSVFDLPYSYVLDGEHDTPVEVDHRKLAMAAAMSAGKALMAKDYGTAMKQVMAAGKHYMAMQNSAENAPAAPAGGGEAESAAGLSDSNAVSQDYISLRTALADVIQFSGCKDSQTSADAFIENESCGAMSYSLIKAFEDFGTDQSYVELLRNIRTTLSGKYSQIPQLSCGHRLHDLNASFSM